MMRRTLVALGLLLTAPAEAQEALEVSGFAPAVAIPADGAGARPVVVVLHGNFDRPEWACDAWRPIVEGRAFLLCPRGIRREDAPDRWQLPDAPTVAREIAAARAALAARYPGRVDDGPDVHVGFSQGAHRVSALASRDPEAYPRIQLVEGGSTLWQTQARYARSRGRVAFVCAMAWCEGRSRRAARRVTRGRAEARVERRAGTHHDLDVMRPAIRETFDWLVEGDPRFAR